MSSKDSKQETIDNNRGPNADQQTPPEDDKPSQPISSEKRHSTGGHELTGVEKLAAPDGSGGQPTLLKCVRKYHHCKCSLETIVCHLHKCPILTCIHMMILSGHCCPIYRDQLSFINDPVGLTPYGINATYAVITLNVQKNADQRAKEALADNITYLFASIAYGGRFYLFMLTSPRFRRMVKNRILQWQPSRRVIPLAK
ncbi:unnamed protein product [Rotaria sp. Silwood1]|nr:unnamed protein product [Rotaria sp. Silwood1]CAF1372440.1 unnamed protein product [Rotaria sp. Silwood1]CAF3572303.1 unnamed protein product [Rotaria sp. Silwood1]CAF4640422.1 unnamed protein product [Rotaria sp. Silwood1]